MPRFRSVLLAVTVAAVATPVAAQTDTVVSAPMPLESPTPAGPHRWHLASGIAVPILRDVHGAILTSIGFTATAAVRPNQLAPDLALVVTPQALLVGAILANGRANLAVPLAVGRSSRLIPSAGLSIVGAAGVGGIGGLRGFNTTVAYHTFARTDGDSTARRGVRIALGRHLLSGSGSGIGDGGGFWLFEVGLVRR